MIVVTEMSATGHVFTRPLAFGDGWRKNSKYPGTFEAIGKWSCLAKHQRDCDCAPLQMFACEECKVVYGHCYGTDDYWPEICDDCRAKKGGRR